MNRFANHTTSYAIKNPTGELLTYTPSGKVNAKNASVNFTLKVYVCCTVCNMFSKSWSPLFYSICFVFGSLLPQRVAVSAVKSSAQLSSKQLMELLFSSKAIRHCKTTPPLQHGFLVQVKNGSTSTVIGCDSAPIILLVRITNGYNGIFFFPSPQFVF